MTDDRQRVRRHEAGHVVIGHALGLESAGAVCIGTGGEAGHWLPTPRQVDGMRRADWAAFQEAIVVIDLAGEAALSVFGDPDPRGGAGPDRARALEAARGIDPAAPEAARDRLYRRALDLAREHRGAIEWFAATLAANHDRLAGDEVADALAAALAGWPSPIFGPERDHKVMRTRRELFERAMVDGSSSSSAMAWILAGRAARARVDAGPSLTASRQIAGTDPSQHDSKGVTP